MTDDGILDLFSGIAPAEHDLIIVDSQILIFLSVDLYGIGNYRVVFFLRSILLILFFRILFQIRLDLQLDILVTDLCLHDIRSQSGISTERNILFGIIICDNDLFLFFR